MPVRVALSLPPLRVWRKIHTCSASFRREEGGGGEHETFRDVLPPANTLTAFVDATFQLENLYSGGEDVHKVPHRGLRPQKGAFGAENRGQGLLGKSWQR